MKGMVVLDDLKTILSRRIKLRLKQLNLKQKDLVERTGQSKSTINKIVNGTVTPRVDVLIPISQALGVSIDWLVDNVQREGEKEEPAFEQELVQLIRKVDVKKRVHIYFILLYILAILEEKK